MLILTKNILENAISTGVAKGIALLLRPILEWVREMGLKQLKSHQAIGFQLILSFLPVLSKFCLWDHRKCHF